MGGQSVPIGHHDFYAVAWTIPGLPGHSRCCPASATQPRLGTEPRVKHASFGGGGADVCANPLTVDEDAYRL
jgi:hypothetical protein